MNDQQVKFLNDLMNSWAVQAIIAAFVIGLVAVAFSRASEILEDGTRRAFRVTVVALGIVVVVQSVVTAMLGRLPLPAVVVIEFLWLFGAWLYYFIRFMTRQRRGPGDAETRRRGAALDGTITRIEEERRHGDGGGPEGRRAVR